VGPLGTAVTDWPIAAFPGDYDMENVMEWRLAKETELLVENSITNFTWPDRRAAAVGSQRLTAWAMARPTLLLFLISLRICDIVLTKDKIDDIKDRFYEKLEHV
jgi:hypothetical protein